jgi:hypothetical protein
MKLAIMQPYFLPYIGYFQLIAAVDHFVLYDNIKYTKKGWINRNRMLQNGKETVFSVPLKADSDSLHIRERELAAGFDRNKLLNQLREAYRKAPYLAQTLPKIEAIVRYEDMNLFRFLHHSIIRICEYLGLSTEIGISSEIAIDHRLNGQEKILALCKALGANTYVNAIGGTSLYSPQTFRDRGVALRFITSQLLEYPQFGHQFLPWLSILDLMMFNSPEQVRSNVLEGYEVV